MVKVLACFAVLALLATFGAWLYPAYPEPAAAEVLIERWPTWSPAQRAESLRALLARLALTDSIEDDRVMRLVLGRLGDLYERTGDAVILDALDATRIGGGFANEVCGLYQRLVRSEAARIHLAAATAGGIRRCEGISWSREELEALLRR